MAAARARGKPRRHPARTARHVPMPDAPPHRPAPPDGGAPAPGPCPMSVIIPASNEEAHIGACLGALAAAPPPEGAEVIVVANGCRDDTAGAARRWEAPLRAAGWRLSVIERPEGGKPGALNAGDAAARGAQRVYLDADVTVEPELPLALNRALDHPEPRYASGRCRIAPPRSLASRAYAACYARVPFMTEGVPGCGLYAVNAAGRARWGAFPEVIADDTFVRLQFTPEERIGLPQGYRWPLVEGFGNLVAVRRRQDAGVRQIAARYPALAARDDKKRPTPARVLALALRHPLGFATYAAVALMVRARPAERGWTRGR